MSGLKHWNPDLVDVIGAAVPITGFAEDGMITFEEVSERFILVKGVDGQFTRSKVSGAAGILTVKLMSSSKSNDYLSALHILGLTLDGGADVAPWAVNDRNGTGLLVAPEAWPIGFPPMNMGTKAEAREWKIQCINYKLFVGGT